MAHTAERTRIQKTRTPTPRTAVTELEAMRASIKQVTSSKRAAKAFLRGAGVLDKQGRLTKPYRP
ncbi:MAG: hypothetical protein JSR49_06430 [Proteobacteria bacterium]|nr:hypothetical protein [Pseudomonadota bacterium]